MATFESTVRQINYPQQSVYQLLSDLSNIDKVKDRIPEDKVKDLDLMISGKYAGIGAVIRYNFAIKNTIID